ncbi:hypothetical protein [Rhodanobacter lindaniclasticus]|uniref:hypothetical protein n=1 Tax=Rhodanobacter lindaniclasticus TaxID=75310 RepID=UPI001444D593|nr:hypothetical protein [Rhodanobacter lindaniclasticus]
MRFVSPSIKAAFLVFFLFAAGVGALSYSSPVRSAGSLPAGCSLVSGVIVCSDGTGANGDPVPPGCSVVAGVTVCGDGSTGSDGSVCVTDASGNKSCLTGGGSWGPGQGSGPTMGQGLGKVLGTPPQVTGTGWLSRLTGWVSYALNSLFAAFAAFLKDLVTYILAAVLGIVALAISSIPVPDWIANNSMGSLLGQTGSIVGFFMVQLKIPAALSLIGAGYAFRLVRKFATLFQW